MYSASGKCGAKKPLAKSAASSSSANSPKKDLPFSSVISTQNFSYLPLFLFSG